MSDFNKPDTASNYSSAFTQEMLVRAQALAKMDFAGFTNLVANAIAWSAANGRFEMWNGSSWAELVAEYMINVNKLGGQAASYYRNADNLNAGTLPAARFNDASHGNRGGGSLHANATTGAAGFMAAADKSKLDGIEAGATADQSAAEILALLLTVDGAGTNLDSDTLDGYHASAFAVAGHGHAGVYSPVGHGHSSGEVSGLGALATMANVGQGQIRTGLQQSSGSGAPYIINFTGGTWTLGWGVASSSSTTQPSVQTVGSQGGYYAGIAVSLLSYTVWFQARYISASPPYDLGDGEIPLFVFAAIDNATGDIVAVDCAQDPPWAYHGPTNIRADFYRNGKGYQWRRDIPSEQRGRCLADVAADPAKRAAHIAALRSAPRVEVEITQAIKNADKDIVPHPFLGNDPTGKTVIMLDPVSQMAQDLRELIEDGESVAKLISDGYLKVDNVPIANRRTPTVVRAHSMRWKNNG